MAIAFDAVNDTFGTGGTVTWSHTCSAGTDRILFVATLNGTGGSDATTGITYGGVALTKLTDVQIPGDRWSDLWYLLNPATGANDVVVTVSGGYCRAISTSYTGVAQTSPDSSGTNSNTTGTTLAHTTTVISSNCWVYVFATGYNTVHPTSIDTMTERAGTTLSIFDSNGVVATGSFSQNSNWPSSQAKVGNIVSFAPAGGSAVSITPIPTLAFLGCG